ncbi:MAG: alkaline phosphatase [bacterium]|nr:alkaline phosphatase [bacterium]
MNLKTLIFCILWIGTVQSSVYAVKNVIIFLADGWGYNHIEATNFYLGVEKQSYQNFPVQYAMSTYSLADQNNVVHDGSQVYHTDLAWSSWEWLLQRPTDSASSSTAISTGVKTYDNALGVDLQKKRLQHAFELGEIVGKSSGLVTTVPFSHATPAGFIAHNLSRKNYEQIAIQMIDSTRLDVIIGAGHPNYNDDGKLREDKEYKYVGGKEFWDKIVAGKAGNDENGDGKPDYWTLVQSKEQFLSLKTGNTPKRLLGIVPFASTLQQKRQNPPQPNDRTILPYQIQPNETAPALSDLVEVAINVLDENPNGFCLMVEGGAIDWAGHDQQPARLIEEMIDFNHAIDAAIQWVEKNSHWNETLIIVTGDHETGYLWGEGSNPDWKPIQSNGKGKLPNMKFYSTRHSNSLVPFYAKGKGSEEFQKAIIGKDKRYGFYIDNTSIGNTLKVLFYNLEKN